MFLGNAEEYGTEIYTANYTRHGQIVNFVDGSVYATYTIYNQSMIVFAYFHRHAVLTEVVSSQDKPSPVFLWKF